MAHPNWLTRLADVKSKFKITSTDYDSVLQQLITQVSTYVEKQTLRRLKPYHYIEYHDGGTSIVVLKQAPVLRVIGVWEDVERTFDSASQLDSEDYYCSANGRLAKLYGTFESGYGSVKVEYWAGFSEHVLSTGNFSIQVNETTHDASVSPGVYNILDLVDALETSLNDLEVGTFTVTFDDDLQRVTISSDVEFLVVSNTEVAEELGFAEQAVPTTEVSSSDAIVGIPQDLKDAVEGIIGFKYFMYAQAKLPLRAESRGDQSLQFDLQDIPLHYRIVIDSYAMRRIG